MVKIEVMNGHLVILVDFGITNSLSICLVDTRGLIAIIPNTANTVGSSLSGTLITSDVFIVFDIDVAVDAIQAWKSYNDLDVVYEEIDYGTIPLLIDNYYSILKPE